MRFSYIASFAVAGAIVTQSSSAMALSATDFSGNYDIDYNTVSAQLQVDVRTPRGDAYPFALDFDLALDTNEQVPYTAVDPIIANAQQVLQEYYPQMPATMQDKVITAFTNALYSAIDEINSQSAALPDDMVVAVYLNANPAPASLTMVDVDAGTQVVLPATVTVAAPVADIWASDKITAEIDSSKGYKGGGKVSEDSIDQTGSKDGVSVHVTGSVECNFGLARQ